MTAPLTGGQRASPPRARSRISHAGFGLVAVVAAACAPSGHAPDVVMRDSAGVGIVENPAPGRAEAYARVADTPLLEIGGAAEDSLALVQVRSAFWLSGGRIAVAHAGGPELRIYDPAGHLLRRIGREGDGPGEFRGLWRASATRGDTIAVWDLWLARLSYFSPDGRFSRSIEFAPRGLPAVSAMPLADGTAVVALRGEPTVTSGVQRDRATLVRVSAGGQVIDTLTSFLGPETDVVETAQAIFFRPVPFGRAGGFTVHEERVYASDGDRYEIQEYLRGTLVRSIRLPRPAVPVSPDDAASFREDRVLLNARGAIARMDSMRPLRVPELMPPFGRFMVDALGHLWVEETPSLAAEPEQVWRVFSAAGVDLGTVRLPDDLDPRQIGANAILVTHADPGGAESVRVYRLVREGP